MRVLQIINSLYTGGAEKLIIDSVPLYQKNALQVDVLVLRKDKTPFWNKLAKTTSGSLIGLTDSSVYNPFLILKLIPQIKNYDIIHAHLFPTLYWVVLAKWISGTKTPIIYTEHNTHNKRRDHFLLKRIDKYIYKQVSKIVTISKEVDLNLKKHLEDNNSKYNLINNGIDVHNIETAQPLNKSDYFSETSEIIIQVSSFRAQKDQPALINSLRFLPDNFKLLLVGDGPLRTDNEELVQQLQLSNRVKFLGLRDDIPGLLKMADYIVLSSHHEGLSLSSIEGMAANKPFLASSVPGLREIVDGYGLLFPQGDDQEIAQLILRLHNNKEEYNKIAERCLARAKEYDINQMIADYIEIYREVTANSYMSM